MNERTTLITVAVAGLLCACGDGGKPASLPDRGVAAHRGASSSHPENTLAAVREAVRLGVHQIEIDVRLTADRRLVLMHDESLERTTDVEERFPDRPDYRISSFTFDEIRTLDAGSWKDEAFAGERVPTLEEGLRAIGTDRWANLDIKGEYELGEAAAAEVLRIGYGPSVILSLRGEAVEGARPIAEGRMKFNNMTRQSTAEEYVTRTIEGGFDFIQFLRDPFPDARGIERLKQRGVRINYCCTNGPEVLRRWFAAGIEFPLVDDAATAVAVAREVGIEPLR